LPPARPVSSPARAGGLDPRPVSCRANPHGMPDLPHPGRESVRVKRHEDRPPGAGNPGEAYEFPGIDPGHQDPRRSSRPIRSAASRDALSSAAGTDLAATASMPPGTGRARSFDTAQPGRAGTQYQQPPSKCLRDPASSTGKRLQPDRIPATPPHPTMLLSAVDRRATCAAAGRARSS
jgi:hypothetical protein